MLRPSEVNVNEGDIRRLTDLYRTAYTQIAGEIEGATDFGVYNRKAILSQIEGILKDLDEETSDLIAEPIRAQYELGAGQAVEQLDQVAPQVPIKSGFNRIHNEAIKALVSDSQVAFAESIQGVYRSSQRLLTTGVKAQLTQQMAVGTVQGAALREVKKNVVGVLRTEGLAALVDKGGRPWSLDRYAEMLIRTKSVEARNTGFMNRTVENGYDLVQISSHGASDNCGDWEGKILSITGRTPGYSTLDQAQDGGLFHPNCKHAANTLIPELAIKTRSYDPRIGKYVASTEDRLKKNLKSATKYDPTFKAKVEKVANNQNLEYKHGAVKTETRAMEKVIKDYNLDPSGLKDTNRSMIFISDPKDVNSIAKAFEKDFSVIGVRDDFDKPGYKKAIINVKTPGGVVSEIQLTTPEFYAAKKSGGQDLYDKVRVKATDWEEAKEKMDKLYSEADLALAKRLNSS